MRLSHGGWAVIRVGAPLPAALAALLGPGEPWGFITAWHPGSRPAPRAANHRAQRALLAALRRQARLIRPAIGVGEGGWREPSLWAAGVSHAQLRRLARGYGQLAFVHGGAVAALALTDS